MKLRVTKRNALVMAAVAGMGAGLAAPAPADEKKGEVKCYGINGCGSHAKCAVSAADIEAVKTLLGAKEFRSRFGKSEVHSCGAHAKCGSGDQILNWVPVSADECRTEGGILIEEKGKKKVAKKA